MLPTVMFALSAIRRMLAAHPDFAQKVIDNLCANLRMLVRTASELAFYQVTHRLARLISTLPDEQLAGESGSRRRRRRPQP